MYTFLVSKGLQRDCDYSLSYIFFILCIKYAGMGLDI